MRHGIERNSGWRSPVATRCLAVAVAGMVAACGDATGPIGNASTSRTDADLPQYELQLGELGWQTTIRFAFTNESDGAVFLDNCNGWTGASFEKLVDGEWTIAVGVGRPDCLSPLIEVRPGKTFETNVPFFAAFPDNEVDPKLLVEGDVEGTYRIVLYGVYASQADATYPFGPEIPKPRRTSAAFRLVEHR